MYIIVKCILDLLLHFTDTEDDYHDDDVLTSKGLKLQENEGNKKLIEAWDGKRRKEEGIIIKFKCPN